MTPVIVFDRAKGGKMNKGFRVALYASLVLLLMFGISNAQNLVTNPGFETVNLGGWLTIHAGSGSFIGASNLPGDVHSGSYAAAFAAFGGIDDSIQQTLPTVPGESYSISFWLLNKGGAPNDFSMSWGGTTLFSLTDAAAFSYTEETVTGTATGSSTVLMFSGADYPAALCLDDVSVTPAPEPGTMLLFGLGLVGLVGMRKFRK